MVILSNLEEQMWNKSMEQMWNRWNQLELVATLVFCLVLGSGAELLLHDI